MRIAITPPGRMPARKITPTETLAKSAEREGIEAARQAVDDHVVGNGARDHHIDEGCARHRDRDRNARSHEAEEQQLEESGSHLFRLVGQFRPFQDRCAALPVRDRHADRAPRHQREPEGDEPVHDADRPVDDRHALRADLSHERDREPDAVAEKEDAQRVHQRGKRARHHPRQQAIEEIDLDMVVLAHVHGGADEGGGDEEVARDLLGPRGRVVQRIAGEELVEDDERQHPEDAEGRPVLEAVVRDVHLFLMDVEVPFGIQDVLLIAHLIRFLLSQLVLKRVAAWFMWRRMAERAAPASWRAIAATISRCSRIATVQSAGVSKWCSRRRKSGPVRWSHSVFTTSARALLPLASAMRRWKRRSAASGATPRRRSSSIWSSASSIARTCVRVAWRAAIAAHSDSMSQRARMSSNGPESAGRVSVRSAGRGPRTYTPEPTRTST